MIVISGGTTIAALSWPVLLALRDGCRRRRALRKLPYAAGPIGVTDPDIPMCAPTSSRDALDDGGSMHECQPPHAPDQQRALDPHCCAHDTAAFDITPACAPAMRRRAPETPGHAAADADRSPPVAPDDDASWCAAQSTTSWRAASMNTRPYDAVLNGEASGIVTMSHDDAPMIKPDSAARGATGPAASSHEQPERSQPDVACDTNRHALSVASPDMAMVLIDTAAGFIAAAQAPSSMVSLCDASAIDSRAAESPVATTLVAASEHAAPMVMLTPPAHAMLALLTMDGARDEAAIDALVRAGGNDDTAAAPGLDAPSHEQPDDADRGMVDEPDWWEQAVVVSETPSSIVTLRSSQPALSK